MKNLQAAMAAHFKGYHAKFETAHDELTLLLEAEDIVAVATELRDQFSFSQLLDICGMDYAEYGSTGWTTKGSSNKGFSRAVSNDAADMRETSGQRFGVVYHLISIENNQRLRLKVRLDADAPIIDSVVPVWACADWYEREAFDLFGILFSGHQDLRRILTDYGFIGHPFRKDFPISGHVEMRYDETQKRVIYEPVDIVPRTLVPRVIRDDNRYLNEGDA